MARDVVEQRLYATSCEDYDAADSKGVTVLVNLGQDPHLVGDPKRHMCVFWTFNQDVDHCAFEGLVRLCASAMRGKHQRVLLVGEEDIVDTIAACILREYLGVGAKTAVNIIRQDRRDRMTRSGLIETVYSYKPT